MTSGFLRRSTAELIRLARITELFDSCSLRPPGFGDVDKFEKGVPPWARPVSRDDRNRTNDNPVSSAHITEARLIKEDRQIRDDLDVRCYHYTIRVAPQSDSNRPSLLLRQITEISDPAILYDQCADK